MIRGSLTANSAQAMMLVSYSKGLAFQRRTTTGGTSTSTAGAFATAPYWVRLDRAGPTISAYQSPDGANWALVGQDTFALGATVFIGLAVSSHVTSTLATATFANVSGTELPPAALPAPWAHTDIGVVGTPGGASFDAAASAFTVKGAGADIWGTADAFRYVYQPLTGDGQIVARVASVQYTAAWVKAGVMIRADLTPGSPHGMMMVTPGKGNNFQRRTVPGGTSTSTAGLMVTAPYWVKLTRTGTSISAYQSADGNSWSLVGTEAIAMPSTVFIGLAVSSHSASTLATATFDRVVITRP
jgi:regulation of enolase protein 1 (concanavalin A-like superfamily)